MVAVEELFAAKGDTMRAAILYLIFLLVFVMGLWFISTITVPM